MELLLPAAIQATATGGCVLQSWGIIQYYPAGAELLVACMAANLNVVLAKAVFLITVVFVHEGL